MLKPQINQRGKIMRKVSVLEMAVTKQSFSEYICHVENALGVINRDPELAKTWLKALSKRMRAEYTEGQCDRYKEVIGETSTNLREI